MSDINVDFTTPNLSVDIQGGLFTGVSLPFVVVDGTTYAQTGAGVQAAVDSLTSGGTVFLAKGTYTITASITLDDNVILRGAGWSTILKLGVSANTDVISVIGKTNVKICDLQVDGTMASNTDGNGINIITASSFVTVENCYIHDVRKTLLRGGTGSNNLMFFNNYCISSTDNDIITLSKTFSSKVMGNIVSTSGSTSDNGIACYDEDATNDTYDNQIIGNYVTLCVNGIGTEGGIRTVISDNIVFNCSGHGITAIDGGTVPVPDYTIIKGNMIKTVASVGINIDADYFVLEGNVISGVNIGIDINSATTSNFNISNNIIETTVANAINVSAAATNFSIVGNIIKTVAGTAEGISLAGCTDGVVSDNQIQGAGGHGIQLSSGGCQRILIANNQINASGQRGISINGNALYNQINGNCLYDCGQEGIYLGNTTAVCSYTTISNNQVINSGFGSGGTTYSGIRLIGSTRCSLNGNVCTDDQGTKTQNYGILEDTSGDYNLIIGNMVEGNNTGGTSVVGTNTLLANNITS